MFKAIKCNLEMAHAVTGNNINEQNIHGHTWKFEVTFEGDNYFDELKKLVTKTISKQYNYSFLVTYDLYKIFEKLSFKNIFFQDPPTCEVILERFYKELLVALENSTMSKHTKIVKVKLWEGNCNYAKIK